MSVLLYGWNIWRKNRWELHKDAAACYLEQILKAEAYTTVSEWPFTSYFTNPSRKASKTCWAQLEMDNLISNVLLDQCWQTKKNYIHQLCADTICRLQDLASVIANSDKWWRRVKGNILMMMGFKGWFSKQLFFPKAICVNPYSIIFIN